MLRDKFNKNWTRPIYLYTENCRTLLREIFKVLNKWSTVFLDQEINIFKMPVLPKLICRFNIIPVNIPAGIFSRDWQADSTVCMEMKDPSAQANCNFQAKSDPLLVFGNSFITTLPHLALMYCLCTNMLLH